MAARRKLNQHGFSLMEVLVVLAISAVMSLMALPFLTERDQVDAEVRRLVADLVRARSWARTTWRETTFDYDLAGRRWRVVDETGDFLPGNQADANGWRTLNPPVRLESVENLSGDFTFLANGRCSAESEVILTDGVGSWRLHVSALTGSVTAEVVAE